MLGMGNALVDRHGQGRLGFVNEKKPSTRWRRRARAQESRKMCMLLMVVSKAAAPRPARRGREEARSCCRPGDGEHRVLSAAVDGWAGRECHFLIMQKRNPQLGRSGPVVG